jgi:hypothetical protein
MALVETRLIRRKSPIPVDPALVPEKEEMLALLPRVRKRSLVFMEETRGKDLSKHHIAHPFLGNLEHIRVSHGPQGPTTKDENGIELR